MYRVLTSPSKTLICTDEVIALAPMDEKVDPRFIVTSIQIAEERFIKPAVCADLYYSFRSLKNVIVTDINIAYLQTLFPVDAPALTNGQIVNSIDLVDDYGYKELWNEFLWQLCAECVMYIASPVNYSRYGNSGEQELNPKIIAAEAQGSGSVDLAKMKWKLDQLMQNRIDPMIAAMQEWMYKNEGSFPYYNCRKRSYGSRTPDGVSIERKTAWVHNIYDDLRNNDCYTCNHDS